MGGTLSRGKRVCYNVKKFEIAITRVNNATSFRTLWRDQDNFLQPESLY